MIITSDDFRLDCHCGKQHSVDVQKTIIQSGAMHGLSDEIAAMGLSGKPVFIYDTNTFDATLGRHPRGEELVLKADGLHADEDGTDQVLQNTASADILVGIGSGVLNDIVRYCAAQKGIPFISVPTAASVDGYSSTVAAMTWGGYKKTVPAVAPPLIVADTDIFAAAPMRLTRSGVGDIIGKFIALAEWRMSNLLTGEYHCPAIARLTHDAVDAAMKTTDGLISGATDAYEQLMYALVLSGIAIQLAGYSRPASGAEHHFAHALEVGVYGKCDALHGEKVGVGTYYVSSAYEQICKLNKSTIQAMQRPYNPLSREYIAAVFGESADTVMEENRMDSLAEVSADDPAAHWADIQRIYSSIPTASEIDAIMKKLGACRRMDDIGMDPAMAGHVVYTSPLIRNRLTLMRLMRRLFADEESFCAEVSL